MAIFNSYVKLPEGNIHTVTCNIIRLHSGCSNQGSILKKMVGACNSPQCRRAAASFLKKCPIPRNGMVDSLADILKGVGTEKHTSPTTKGWSTFLATFYGGYEKHGRSDTLRLINHDEKLEGLLVYMAMGQKLWDLPAILIFTNVSDGIFPHQHIRKRSSSLIFRPVLMGDFTEMMNRCTHFFIV